ncbi:MAG: type II toxin-antitoxin system VapC family toxin [Patescibacteria group bacterium]
MTAVDTNVLVRLLTDDDPSQAERAARLFQDGSVFIAKTVLLETEWVLRHAYGLSRDVCNAAFVKLLGLPGVSVEDMPAAGKAMAWYAAGLDFADALHLAAAGGAERFVTFDRDFVKRAAKVSADVEVRLV